MQIRKVVLLLATQVTLSAWASSDAVQSAQCPASDGPGGNFACCLNEDWASVLWVQTSAPVNSAESIRDVCQNVNADFNAWGEPNCTLNTHIFNQPSTTIVNPNCVIHNYKPFANADAAKKALQRKQKLQ